MTAPHDAPDAAGLIEAVREFLERLTAESDGRTSFDARVAARVLSMVERELAAGPAMAQAHAARLAELGYRDDAELATAVRAGQLDDRRSELIAALWDTALDKLAVANPTYPDPSDRRPQ